MKKSNDKNLYAFRIAVLFGAVFLILGVHLPFFPVWLDLKGLEEREIATIIAAPLIARVIFTPVISYVADHINNHRRVLIFLAWGTLFSLLALYFTNGFWQIFFISLIFAMFWTTIIPLSDVIAMSGVRKAGIDYGRVRIWGSITFILASLIAGAILQTFGAPWALWLLIIAAIFVICATHLLPQPQGQGRLKTATGQPVISPKDAFRLCAQPLFILFVLTTSFAQTSHAVIYGFGTLHWQGLGFGSATIGSFWALGVISEIILFIYAKHMFEKFGAAWLLLASGLAGILRWTLLATDPHIIVIYGCQILHAFTFGAAHLASVDFVTKSVAEKHTGTALGLYAAVTTGIAMGIATYYAGDLYQTLDANAYLVMAALSTVSTIGAGLLLIYWRQQELL